MDAHLGLLILFSSLIGAYCVPAKWCTLSQKEQQKCQAFKAALQGQGIGPGIECTQVLHEAECLRKIAKGEMDVISVGDKGIFASGRKAGLKPIMSEKITGPHAESFLYKAVMAVKKSDTSIQKISDLKDKKSCHTGVMRTVGWVIPMGALYKKANMLSKDCDNNVKAIAAFFSQSCAPGAFDPYNNPDGDNPANVCGACADVQCPASGSSPEKYSGYAGAFQGLVDNRCDIAFVKHSTIPTDAKGKFAYSASDYELLCPDGTRKSVDSWNSCNWATRPFRAIMSRSDYAVDTFTAMMNKAMDYFGPQGSRKDVFELFNSTKYGGQSLMFSDSTNSLVNSDTPDYKQFLGEGYLNSYESFRPGSCAKRFRWCTTSDEEFGKCQEMGFAMAARRMTLDLSCVKGRNPDDCFDLIKSNKADLLTVDGGHVYRGGKYFNLQPIAAEVYDTSLGKQETSYYAVAVTLKSNRNVDLNNMKNKKTCHTGFGRTSGWNVPVGYFVNKGDIKFDPNKCDVGAGAAAFFGDMCTPGALEPEYNPGNHPPKMCALCPQDCQSKGGKYDGYIGALRCLVKASADVAFVKHTTVRDLINQKPDWLPQGMSTGDFELLCKDGSRKPVEQWETCNLARVPSHAVVTSRDRSPEQIRHYQIALNRAQIQYNTKADGTPNDRFFSIFKSTNNTKDLLFKDSTKKLQSIKEPDYQKFLGTEYLETVTALDPQKCSVGASDALKVSLAALVVGALMSIIW